MTIRIPVSRIKSRVLRRLVILALLPLFIPVNLVVGALDGAFENIELTILNFYRAWKDRS